MCLDYILIDVTGGHNNIKVGFRALTDGVEVLVTLGHVALDARQTGIDIRLHGLFDLVDAMQGQCSKIQLAVHHVFGNLLGCLLCLNDGIAHKIEHALTENTLLQEGVHHNVRERHAVFIYPVNTNKTAEGAFHSNRCIAIHELLHLVSYVLCQLLRSVNLCEIKS